MNENDIQSNQEFKHSPDYCSVIFKGKHYTFTPHAAQAIQLLHEQYLYGTP